MVEGVVVAARRLDFLVMSTKEVGSTLRELFQTADLDGDGFLDQSEFVTILRWYSTPEPVATECSAAVADLLVSDSVVRRSFE